MVRLHSGFDVDVVLSALLHAALAARVSAQSSPEPLRVFLEEARELLRPTLQARRFAERYARKRGEGGLEYGGDVDMFFGGYCIWVREDVFSLFARVEQARREEQLQEQVTAR